MEVTVFHNKVVMLSLCLIHVVVGSAVFVSKSIMRQCHVTRLFPAFVVQRMLRLPRNFAELQHDWGAIFAQFR